MNQSGNWETSYRKGMELAEQGKMEPATYYLLNALAHNPGNLEVIRGYHQMVLGITDRLVSEGHAEDAEQKLEWLAAFLREQVPAVEPNDLAVLIEVIDSVESKRAAAEASEGVADESPDPEQAAGRKALLDGVEQGTVPRDVEEIVALIGVAEQWRAELAGDGNAATMDLEAKLAGHASRLGAALAFERGLAELDENLTRVDLEKNATVKGVCLQSCDGPVRQMVTVLPLVGNDAPERLEAAIARLRAKSEEIAESIRSDDSIALMRRFELEHLGLLSAHGIRPRYYEPVLSPAPVADVGVGTPKVAPNIPWVTEAAPGPASKVAPSIPWVTEAAPGPAKPTKCQSRLEDLGRLAEALTEILPGLTSKEVAATAKEILKEISNAVVSVSREQHDRYNNWAYESVQKAFTQAVPFVGLTSAGDKEKDIGLAILNHMDAIDSRLLFPDVQRCYSEVFEYLFGRLKGHKNKDDFQSYKRKLGVLNSMITAKKKQYSDF